MNYERYEPIQISKDALEFTFISVGPKGIVIKLVQFTKTGNPEIYNLAFGDILPDGKVDDQVTNDNHDRNKVLATVVITIYYFTNHYPDKYVLFSGSTEGRTRLYRMAIANKFDILANDFEIYGLILENNGWVVDSFKKNKAYDGFLVKRRFC